MVKGQDQWERKCFKICENIFLARDSYRPFRGSVCPSVRQTGVS